jgi:hypothetical protein
MRTRSLVSGPLTFSLPGAVAILLIGCAVPPQRMVVQKAAVPVSARLIGKMAIGDVTGDKSATSTSSVSAISDSALRAALSESLRQLGYLSSTPEAAGIVLRVGVVDVEKSPEVSGLKITVLSIIRYAVATRDGGKPIFDELITASCTRTISDDLSGYARMRHAEECAVSSNFASFLTRLSASSLD